jgi:hypothetical protein
MNEFGNLMSYFSKNEFNVIIRCKILVYREDEYECHSLVECDAV